NINSLRVYGLVKALLNQNPWYCSLRVLKYPIEVIILIFVMIFLIDLTRFFTLFCPLIVKIKIIKSLLLIMLS
ncbi:MAG TPA: hypothetical protein PKW14_05170, partial [Bacteroidota bacterium]|nr:hypothetical protein [Bacteroidota bacterium]